MVKITIDGPIRSGKNNMQFTRSGRHFPLKSWAIWRDGVVASMMQQCRPLHLAEPCSARIIYRPSDKRRRDVPGMVDALWHCLERAGIVNDDTLIEDVEWITDRNGIKPGAEIYIETNKYFKFSDGKK